MRLFAAFVTALLAVPSAHAQRAFFDGRLTPNPTRATASEEAAVRRAAETFARPHWARDQTPHTENIAVLDVAPGSFTRAGARQRAVLYRYAADDSPCCEARGVVVLEGTRPVLHLAFYGFSAVGRAADMNGDRRDELLLAGRSLGQGVRVGNVGVLALGPDAAATMASFMTYEDTCARDGANGTAEAQRFAVRAGRTPEFFATSYQRPCSDGAAWRATGPQRRFDPDRSPLLVAVLPVL